MTTTLNTKIAKFCSYDDYNNNTDKDLPHYEITVTVELKQHNDGKQYYYVDYKYNFIKSENYSEEINDKLKVIAHPFYGWPHIESRDGDIIFCNKMIEQMIDHLLLSDEELSKISGATEAQHYRKLIMVSLANFWD